MWTCRHLDNRNPTGLQDANGVTHRRPVFVDVLQNIEQNDSVDALRGKRTAHQVELHEWDVVHSGRQTFQGFPHEVCANRRGCRPLFVQFA